jgi:hypothetical protein
MKTEITVKMFFEDVVATGIRTIEDMQKRFPLDKYNLKGNEYFHIVSSIKRYKTLNYNIDNFKQMLIFYIDINREFIEKDFDLILSAEPNFSRKNMEFRTFLVDVSKIITDQNHEDFFLSLFSLKFMDELLKTLAPSGSAYIADFTKEMIQSMAPNGFFFKDIERFLECAPAVTKLVNKYDLEKCSDEVRLYLELI